ncbi:MAG: energy-coupling factor transporter transmembrane component T [Tissierellia bacterium]|nr:energy-coupling factor transporter transmembrane component T [Tissierellia bacterium]
MRKLNPGYKLLTLIIASLILSSTYNIKLNLIVFFTAIILTLTTPGINRKYWALSMVPFLVAAFGMFMTGLIFPAAKGAGTMVGLLGERVIYATSLDSALKLTTRILAYGGLGMLFAFTTNSMELIMSLMQQFHMSPKFAYGILAAYHFFPVIKSEYRILGAALKVRGIKAGLFSKKRLFPMIVHAVERSESLAMAMESRGFDDKRPRAIAFKVSLSILDIAFLVGVNVFIIFGIFLL